MAAKPKPRDDSPPADSFERLIREFAKMPGIGRRSAERLAYYVLGQSASEAMALAYAVRDVKKNLHPCAICGDLTESAQCAICADSRRNTGLICVVEWPRDLRAIEKSGEFRGRYHVLMGRLSPLSAIGPQDLRIAQLLERIKSESVQEILLATSPTIEGDATANFIVVEAKKVHNEIVLSRLARGVPEGSDLSFAQSGTIGEALKGRKRLSEDDKR